MLQLSFCYHLQRWQHNQSAHLLLCIRLFNRISSCFRKLQRAKKDNHNVNLTKSKFLMFHHAWRNILLLTAFRACLSSSLILECPVIEVTIEFIEQRKSKPKPMANLCFQFFQGVLTNFQVVKAGQIKFVYPCKYINVGESILSVTVD